uniref:Uncharacterized protein n=1 Tax=Opuntia streptacantha TaxID=393608 RepID=A0A7C8ZD82_OPUST
MIISHSYEWIIFIHIYTLPLLEVGVVRTLPKNTRVSHITQEPPLVNRISSSHSQFGDLGYLTHTHLLCICRRKTLVSQLMLLLQLKFTKNNFSNCSRTLENKIFSYTIKSFQDKLLIYSA